jgi:pimeloyl-ACP methyl ester carboxylesterase
VTVAPAFRESASPDPLFVLAGGPGQAGSDVLPLLSAAFKRVRATRDIVFIDQRGTGLSGKLDCEAARPGTMSDAEHRSRAARAASAPPRAVRRLHHRQCRARHRTGAPRARLRQDQRLGRLLRHPPGQAYARAYPGQRARLVLDGVAAPDQVIPAGGRDGQAALDKLFAQCAAGRRPATRPIPEPARRIRHPAARVEAGAKLSIADPRTAQPVSFTMTASASSAPCTASCTRRPTRAACPS